MLHVNRLFLRSVCLSYATDTGHSKLISVMGGFQYAEEVQKNTSLITKQPLLPKF